MGCEAIFYAVSSKRLGRTLAFFVSPEEAQAALDSVLEEEPEMANDLEVVRIDFSGTALVEPVR
ncbi:MAG: hypothetical protein ACE5EV_05440 [Gaiellales bacterium]